MREQVEMVCRAMMDSLAFCGSKPAGFRKLARAELEERTARLARQAAGTFPPWLVLPILTYEAITAESPGAVDRHDGRHRAAYQTAAAWELGNAAAAHLDAWQDQDTDDALWRQIGPEQTVNLAMGFTALSFRTLCGLGEDDLLPGPTVDHLYRGFADTLLRMTEGQHADLGDDLTLDDYGAVAAAKSGALFRLACWSGAVVAGAPAEVADRYGAFGEALGLLIQAWNDLYGLEGALGKQDRGHQRTLPVLAGLAVAQSGKGTGETMAADAVEQGGRLYAAIQATMLNHRAAETLARCPAAGQLPIFVQAYSPQQLLVGASSQEG